MINQLNQIRPVAYANNLHGDIDAQRDARHIKLLRELRPMLHALRTHRLPRYPCYLLAHPDARRHSTVALLAQRRDIPRVARFRQARRHRVVHRAAMANALSPPPNIAGPKEVASNNKTTNDNNVMEHSTTEGPSQLPAQDQQDLTTPRTAQEGQDFGLG